MPKAELSITFITGKHKTYSVDSDSVVSDATGIGFQDFKNPRIGYFIPDSAVLEIITVDAEEEGRNA